MEHNNDWKRVYISISAGNWKQRQYNHRHRFSKPWLRNQTALSKIFGTLMIGVYIPSKVGNSQATANNFNGSCNLCIDLKNKYN